MTNEFPIELLDPALRSAASCNPTRRVGKRAGFTLLEVIIALAMLALIAVPAVGLATLVVSKSKEQLTTGVASELKERIDIALRANSDPFDESFVSDEADLVFLASQDLLYIEENGSVSTENDTYYRVLLTEPEGYDYQETDAYRVIVYEVNWPYEAGATSYVNQLFFTSVFRR